MRIRRSITAAVLAAVAGLAAAGTADAAGPAHPTPSVITTPENPVVAIRTLEATWVTAFAARRADEVVALYTDDGRWMGPNAPTAQGHDAIRQQVTGAFAAGVDVAHPQQDLQIVVADSGEQASVTGVYQIRIAGPTGPVLVDTGKFVHLLAHTTIRGWRITTDIFNSDLPAAH